MPKPRPENTAGFKESSETRREKVDALASKLTEPGKKKSEQQARAERKVERERKKWGRADSSTICDPERLEMILNALMMRKGGASYLQIAKQQGRDEQEIREDVVGELRRIREFIQEEAAEHLQLQLERINDMILAQWPTRSQIKSAQMILTLMARQDELMGVAVAQKIDVTMRPTDLSALEDKDLDLLLLHKLKYMNHPEPIKREAKG